MTREIVRLLLERDYKKGTDQLYFDLKKESDLKAQDNEINVEVKSADDVLHFLNYLEVVHSMTVESLDDLYFKEKGLHIGEMVYLNLGIQP
jgi:hypothetical protein